MLNHRLPRQTTWEYKDSKGGFVIESNENIARGEQIYDSYGEKCNSRFFLNYGFIVLNNQSNEVALKVWFDPTDHLFSVKRQILNSLQDFKSFRVSEDTGCKKMIHFISYVRFVEYEGPPMDLYQIFAKATSNKNKDDDDDSSYNLSIPPISFENELKVINKLKKLCSDQIARYSTKYDEDLVILEKTDLTENQRNAVLMRSGEKKILHGLEGLANVCIEYSQMGYKVSFNRKQKKNLVKLKLVMD